MEKVFYWEHWSTQNWTEQEIVCYFFKLNCQKKSKIDDQLIWVKHSIEEETE